MERFVVSEKVKNYGMDGGIDEEVWIRIVCSTYEFAEKWIMEEMIGRVCQHIAPYYRNEIEYLHDSFTIEGVNYYEG